MLSGDNPVKVEISIKRERCLHTKSVWTKCRACSDACPSGAISSVRPSELPLFDSSKCLHCGTCLTSCPHEAFLASNFSERKVIKRIAHKGPVRLRCLIPQGEISELSCDVKSYQLGTCLAALTPGALFEIAFTRQCVLTTTRCRTCALYKAVGQTLEHNIRAAKQLLGDWGRAGNLVDGDTLDSSGEQDSHISRSVLEFDEKASADVRVCTEEVEDDGAPFNASLSVRNLFNKLQKRANVPDDPADEDVPIASIRRHEISWRRALKDIWEKAEPGQVQGMCYPWPVQVVNKRACLGCGMCMQMCPTGSIRHTLRNETLSFLFVPGTCADCGLCAMACQQHALRHRYQPMANPFSEIVCYTQSATVCVRCGGPALSEKSVRGYCSRCALELGIVDTAS